jgi:hypothetical protein
MHFLRSTNWKRSIQYRSLLLFWIEANCYSFILNMPIGLTNRQWKLSNGLFMRLAVQSTFMWLRVIVFSRLKDIITICPPEQIEIRTLKKKTTDRVQTETTVVPKIYQEELARSNFIQTVLTLVFSISFSTFFLLLVLIVYVCYVLCLRNLAEILVSIFKNKNFAILDFAVLPFPIHASAFAIVIFSRKKISSIVLFAEIFSVSLQKIH